MARKKKNEQDTGLEPGADFVPTRLRAIDIQNQEFRTSFRGYNPADVDEFLDRLTADYAAIADENKRLKDGLPLGAPGASSAQADDIIRQARAEADMIVAAARREAEAAGSAPGVPVIPAAGGGDPMTAVWPFLNREREFLRALAAMVQEHAEGVKTQAREVQQSAKAAPIVPAAPAPATAAPVEAAAPAVAAAIEQPSVGEAPAPGVEDPDIMAVAVAESEVVAERTESAWDATAAGAESAEPVPAIPPSDVDTPEPSLRELFWGEEN